MSGIARCHVPAGPFATGSDPAEEHAPDSDGRRSPHVGFRFARAAA